MDALPHWKDAELFPEIEGEPQWGVFRKDALERMPLARILELIGAGPGQQMWHGGNENPDIAFVTRPGTNRPVPAAECLELAAALLARDEAILARDRRLNGFLFYPLLVITLTLAIAAPQASLLPAVFTLTSGTAHMEAWLRLRLLRKRPQQYLERVAAQLRYATWLAMSGNRHRCRSCWLAAAWAAIALLEWTTPSSAVEAAALVKEAVGAEPWRLLTAAMLHGGILHLVMNAGAMLSLGPMLERGAHRHLLAPVWLLGAVAGNLLSWATTPATSIGASGGILAVFAFLVVMGWRRRSSLPPGYASSLVRGLVVIAFLGAVAWGVIDNAAHLGGALAGAAMGAWIFRDRGETLPLVESQGLRLVGIACEVGCILVALLTAGKLLRLA